jgi:hypothetical protein
MVRAELPHFIGLRFICKDSSPQCNKRAITHLEQAYLYLSNEIVDARVPIGKTPKYVLCRRNYTRSHTCGIHAIEELVLKMTHVC